MYGLGNFPRSLLFWLWLQSSLEELFRLAYLVFQLITGINNLLASFLAAQFRRPSMPFCSVFVVSDRLVFQLSSCIENGTKCESIMFTMGSFQVFWTLDMYLRAPNKRGGDEWAGRPSLFCHPGHSLQTIIGKKKYFLTCSECESGVLVMFIYTFPS